MDTYNVKIRLKTREGYSEVTLIHILVFSVEKPVITVDKIKNAKILYEEE